MDKAAAIGRLALRAECDSWNAYFARLDTMDGALLLGSIAMGAVTRDPARRLAFVEMMQDIVSELIKEQTGAELVWGKPGRGPEHERAGRA
jgi:hypothetical protein